MRIGTSASYTLCYIDIINSDRKIEEWDERPQLPLKIIFDGDGSYLLPY